MKVRHLCIAVLSFCASGLPMAAHHSFAAEYDSAKPIDLKGTVTKVEWMNPHAHFYVDVKGTDGKVVNWNLELASPNMLARNGWTRKSLKEGDQVTINASRAKDGTNTAAVVNITVADGRKFTFMAVVP